MKSITAYVALALCCSFLLVSETRGQEEDFNLSRRKLIFSTMLITYEVLRCIIWFLLVSQVDAELWEKLSHTPDRTGTQFPACAMHHPQRQRRRLRRPPRQR